MKVDQCTSHPSFGMTPGQRFARDHRSSVSLLIGCEAGDDIVAMVTIEHIAAHLEWEALVWRGAIVLMEMSGTCADVPGVVEAQIRSRIADRRARSRQSGKTAQMRIKPRADPGASAQESSIHVF